MPPRLPGWVWNGERMVADDTPEGGLARGMVVLGGCRLRPECTRHVRLDLEQLSHRGLGRAPLAEVRRRYECHRLPHCEMSWIETYPEGVPLQAYVGDREVWLSVTCEACRASQVVTFERMIRALVASRRGDGNTGVRVIAQRLRRPCKACGALRWRVEVEREQASGAGPPRPVQRPKPEVERGVQPLQHDQRAG